MQNLKPYLFFKASSLNFVLGKGTAIGKVIEYKSSSFPNSIALNISSSVLLSDPIIKAPICNVPIQSFTIL